MSHHRNSTNHSLTVYLHDVDDFEFTINLLVCQIMKANHQPSHLPWNDTAGSSGVFSASPLKIKKLL